MWAFPPEERANHQGWDESEEGPVNQNEWAPLRALVSTRPQRISQPPFASGTWSSGCKERSRRSPAQSCQQTQPPRCKYSISYFLFAHLSSIMQTAGQIQWHHYWIFILCNLCYGACQTFVSDFPPKHRAIWVNLTLNSNPPPSTPPVMLQIYSLRLFKSGYCYNIFSCNWTVNVWTVWSVSTFTTWSDRS